MHARLIHATKYMLVVALILVSLFCINAWAVAADTPQTLVQDTVRHGEIGGDDTPSEVWFAIDYPGDGIEIMVRALFAFADPDMADVAGVRLHGLREFETNGFLQDGGLYTLIYRGDTSGRLWLRVYNNSGLSAPYTITLEGSRGRLLDLSLSDPDPSREADPVQEDLYTLMGDALGPYDTDLEYLSLLDDRTTIYEFTGYDPNAAVIVRSPSGNRAASGFRFGEERGNGVAVYVHPHENGEYQYDIFRNQGMLIGNSGGASCSYWIRDVQIAGEITVRMAISPADPTLSGAVGFELWSPSGRRVAVSTHHKDERHDRLLATFCVVEKGDYLLKVYNYADGRRVFYRLHPAD